MHSVNGRFKHSLNNVLAFHYAMRIKGGSQVLIIIVILVISLFSARYLLLFFQNRRKAWWTETSPANGTLLMELKQAKTIMWVGTHTDDELYTAGALGYFTRDLGGHLVIVSLYYNPEFSDCNRRSAEFLGGADYIRIQEKMYREEGIRISVRCHGWSQLDNVVKELEEAGVKEYLKRLIVEYKPDIIFGFESTNGFRHSCQHVSFAIIVDEAVKELWEEGYTFFKYYYVLNRDPNWFGEKNMDPPPVTDVINLDDKMWSYKLTLFDIYSEFYPQLGNSEFHQKLMHKEWFRKVSTANIGSAAVYIHQFISGAYANRVAEKALSNLRLKECSYPRQDRRI